MSMKVLDYSKVFYRNFKGEKGVIGFSFFGRPIYYYCVEKSDFPIIIVQCAMHAREYITSWLCFELINHFLKNGKLGRVYFIPIMNPDGVHIVENLNPLYKANGRGVDLNVNFDARWGSGKLNAFVAGAENYIGKFPFSEPETLSLKNFTLFTRPNATISYHSKGEEIYWKFFQNENLDRDYDIANAVAKVTGYKLVETPYSAGGYKDWCIQELSIPSLTIEVGNDNLSHPIEKENLGQILDKNKCVLTVLINKLWEQRCKKNL